MNQAAQRHFRVGGNHAQIAIEVAVVEGGAAFDELDVIFKNARRADYVRLFALDLERIVEETSLDAEAGFENANVFISRPKQGFDAATDLNG